MYYLENEGLAAATSDWKVMTQEKATYQLKDGVLCSLKMYTAQLRSRKTASEGTMVNT